MVCVSRLGSACWKRYRGVSRRGKGWSLRHALRGSARSAYRTQRTLGMLLPVSHAVPMTVPYEAS